MSKRTQSGVKRALDAAIACIGLLLLAPLFALIATLIWLDSPGPVFFLQNRVGLQGKTFRMLKFRTMQDGAEEAGSGVYVEKADPRITRVGRILRRFSLDELPQLIHVFFGEMSLVGPRPALPYQLQYYSAHARRRLEVLPGITGWSQVNGRNLISWPKRIEGDVWYVENFSLALDVRILLRTPAVWLSGEGLYGQRENFFISGRDDIPMASGKRI